MYITKENTINNTKFHFNSLSNDISDGLSATIYFPRCNLRCQYCYNLKNLQSYENSLTHAEVKEKIRGLTRELNGETFRKVDWIVMSGGECILQLSSLEEFLHYSKCFGFKTCVFTNGIIVNDLNRLIKILKECQVNRVSVDFKAWTDKKCKSLIETYDAFVYTKMLFSFLKELSKNNIEYEIRTVLIKNFNYEDYKGYADFINKVLDLPQQPIGIHLSNVILNNDTLKSLDTSHLVSEEELDNFIKQAEDIIKTNHPNINLQKHYLLQTEF